MRPVRVAQAQEGPGGRGPACDRGPRGACLRLGRQPATQVAQGDPTQVVDAGTGEEAHQAPDITEVGPDGVLGPAALAAQVPLEGGDGVVPAAAHRGVRSFLHPRGRVHLATVAKAPARHKPPPRPTPIRPTSRPSTSAHPSVAVPVLDGEVVEAEHPEGAHHLSGADSALPRQVVEGERCLDP